MTVLNRADTASPAETLAATVAVLGASRNFKTAIKHLSEGGIDASDLRILAYTGWEQLPDQPVTRVALLKKAFEKCPRELAGDRLRPAGPVDVQLRALLQQQQLLGDDRRDGAVDRVLSWTKQRSRV